MKVLLVVPPSYRFGPFDWHTFHLGLGYLAAVLARQGHVVRIYDANIPGTRPRYLPATHLNMATLLPKYFAGLEDAGGEAWREVRETLRAEAPEVVGITAKVVDMGAALRVAAIAKELQGGRPVVVGGPGATTCPELFLKDPCVDYVMRGEGEVAAGHLLQALAGERERPDVEGLSWRGPAGPVHNALAPLVEDLESLPLPLREALILPPWLAREEIGRIMGAIITSRGCPYACTYCANRAVWGSRRVRLRAAASITAELREVQERFGCADFVFWDDHFSANKERALEICREIRAARLSLSWVGFLHARSVDLDVLRAMRDAGCREVQIGVESGSDRVLSLIDKHVTTAVIERAVSLVRRAGLRLHVFLMVGFPSETAEEMKSTLDFAFRLRPDSVLLSITTPYPGTKLFEEVAARGTLRECDWLGADTYSPESALVDTMSKEAFRTLALRLMRTCDRYNAAGRLGRALAALRWKAWERRRL